MKTEKIPARYMATDESGKDVWVCNIYASTESELINEGIDTFDEIEDPSEEAFWINQLINLAKGSGLITEVIQFALKSQKEDPRLTPAMSMKMGFDEWIK
jgi:hypothetical protein